MAELVAWFETPILDREKLHVKMVALTMKADGRMNKKTCFAGVMVHG